MNRMLKKNEKQAIMQVVREGIVSGEFQSELEQEIAPLLDRASGAIVIRGTLQNTRAVVVSPVTVARWATRNVVAGGYAVADRYSAWTKAHAEKAAKAKAERAKAAKAAMRRAKPRKATGKRAPATAMA